MLVEQVDLFSMRTCGNAERLLLIERSVEFLRQVRRYLICRVTFSLELFFSFPTKYHLQTDYFNRILCVVIEVEENKSVLCVCRCQGLKLR